MNVYTCVDHAGHWVGVASVVVAETEDEGRKMLAAALIEHGLDARKNFTLRQISIDKPQAFILQDGDY